MLHELIRERRIMVCVSDADELHTLHASTPELWTWQSLIGSAENWPRSYGEQSPTLLLLFLDINADSNCHLTAWQTAAERWPLCPARVVRLESVTTNPGLAVTLLEQHPILIDLLPARLLPADKVDDSPLFASEINALARLGWLGSRIQRLSEVSGVDPAKGSNPPTWRYRSWWSGIETPKPVALAEEARPRLWSYLDPIVLLAQGAVAFENKAWSWNARLEQFRAFG